MARRSTVKVPALFAGQKIGRLTLRSRCMVREKNGSTSTRWVCQCDCGNEKTIRANSLSMGRSMSCGCLAAERVKTRNTTHGLSGRTSESNRTYKIWRLMLDRCFNDRHDRFKDYGGRGITACDRWCGENGVVNFVADMGLAPAGHMLDRRDNEKGYSPGNCRWVTRKVQNRNTRSNRMLTFNGKTACLAEHAEDAGLQPVTVAARLTAGWSVEKALTTPSRRRKPVGLRASVPKEDREAVGV